MVNSRWLRRKLW